MTLTLSLWLSLGPVVLPFSHQTWKILTKLSKSPVDSAMSYHFGSRVILVANSKYFWTEMLTSSLASASRIA